ncbi:hypothetical protein CC117_24580 [Parafrankia colletiae]|uniref:Uncharacterized protein n=1 Tax=Parafrankia colletiae TaxID=573497 RepID=A0A1S1QHI2_9ACTN|nr:hypothetical protein [Parafrankia colletiae]MCK9901638.1 hypothetical protein [Frankia sp. Cpl3]OHV32725.1 hypothetical protein CC117_24580 [Parafrankia colletiae]
MADIVTIAASIDGVPTMTETDAMLEELRRLPRTNDNQALIDDLLEFRSLLAGRRVETVAGPQ